MCGTGSRGWRGEECLRRVSKAKAAASALFATAKEDGAVRDNPIAGTRYVPSAGVLLPRKRRPADAGRARPLHERTARRVAAAVLAARALGPTNRRGVGLGWGHVHLGDDPHLEIRDQIYEGKRKALKTSNAYRTVPVSPGMARALADWRVRSPFGEACDPVFASTTGTPLSYANLYRRVLAPAPCRRRHPRR